MFLKLNMSLISNNTANVAETLIWNTLIPSRPELPNNIVDSDDNENEEDDDLSQCQSKVRKLTIHVDFKPFNFLV